MKLALPGSSNMQTSDFIGNDAVLCLSQRHLKKVFVAVNEGEERTAFLLLQHFGYENLAILRGGFAAFDETILNPSIFVLTGSRWDAGAKAFRENARVEILRMIAANKNNAPKEIIQGGC